MKKTEYIKEIKTLPVEELKTRARSLSEELMKLRFRKTTGQLEQSHRMREVRRSLARVQTILTKKAQEAQTDKQQV